MRGHALPPQEPTTAARPALARVPSPRACHHSQAEEQVGARGRRRPPAGFAFCSTNSRPHGRPRPPGLQAPGEPGRLGGPTTLTQLQPTTPSSRPRAKNDAARMPPKDAAGRWRCPVAGCPDSCGRMPGWRDKTGSKAHVAKHCQRVLRVQPQPTHWTLWTAQCVRSTAPWSTNPEGIHPSCRVRAARQFRNLDPGRAPRDCLAGYAVTLKSPVRKHIPLKQDETYGLSVSQRL